MRVALLLAVVLMAMGSAMASTVTLRGACSTYASGNYLNFTINNSGNGTAFDVILTPNLEYATPAYAAYYMGNLTPNSSKGIRIGMENISMQGTFVNYMIAAYGQGNGQVFTAMFPCITYIGNATQSVLYLSADSTTGNGAAHIGINVLNGGGIPLNVTLSLILPPDFSYPTGSQKDILLGPYGSGGGNFTVGFTPGDAIYSGAAAAQYTYKGKHYASMVLFEVSTAQPQGVVSALISYLPLIVTAVIAVLFAFMVFRIARRRMRNGRKEQQHKGN